MTSPPSRDCQVARPTWPSASGLQSVSSTYDPLGRPLVVTTDDDPTAAVSAYTTTYAYPTTTSATRADASGSYSFTLDAAGRQTGLSGPYSTGLATAYRADGQVAAVAYATAPGRIASHSYDAAGRPTGSSTPSVATVPRWVG